MPSAIRYVWHVWTMFCSVITENGTGSVYTCERVCVQRCSATLGGLRRRFRWTHWTLNPITRLRAVMEMAPRCLLATAPSDFLMSHKSDWVSPKKEKKVFYLFKVLFAVEHHWKPNRCSARSWSHSFGSTKGMKSFLQLALIFSNTTSEAQDLNQKSNKSSSIQLLVVTVGPQLPSMTLYGLK